MTWPLPSDYAEAIQNPQLCFADRDLRRGQVATDRLGLPRPITGNFASVFRVQAGNRSWAVRCFLREVPDMQRRYAAIAAHLSHAKLPYMVQFEYQTQGIRVRGTWYPIVKMAWVNGQSLDAYVAQHLPDPERLRRLAEKWVKLVADLRRAGIAHGDLQHGNVLVINDELKLVDYDGMFVPALKGEPSPEIGHRNYQHPGRNESTYDENTDSFSAWTIYISLVALSIRPELWNEVKAGDECLLFRREDFVTPDGSSAWRALGRVRDTRLSALANLFRSIVYLPLEQVPPLDDTTSALAGAGRGRMMPGSADWLRDFVEPAPSAGTPPAPSTANPPPAQAPQSQAAAPATVAAQPAARTAAAGQGVGASWVADHTPPPAPPPRPAVIPVAVAPAAGSAASVGVAAALGAPPASPPFAYQPLAERLVLLTYLLFLAVTTGMAVGTLSPQPVLDMLYLQTALAVDAVAGVLTGGFLIVRYNSLDVVRARRALEREVRGLQSDLDRLTATLGKLDAQGRDLAQQEKVFEDRAHKAIAETADRYQARRAALQHEEAEALGRALAGLQEEHVLRTLQGAVLDKTPPPGIGAKLRLRLREAGLHTAADVTLGRLAGISGVGAARSLVLLAWRKAIESAARQTAPQHLPADVEQPLRSKWVQQLAEVDREGAAALRTITQELNGKRATTAQKREVVNQDVQQTRQAHYARSLELAATLRDLGVFPAITPATYLARVFNLEARTTSAPQILRRIGCGVVVALLLIALCGACVLGAFYLPQWLGSAGLVGPLP